MQVKQLNINDLRPYEQNPRINDAAVDAVAASITEFGFRQPIVVDEQNIIIVGHTRWKAAKKLGLKKVPVHVATGLTPEQVRAYRVADNKLAELAEWNLDLLPIELAGLQEMDVDLGLLGFDQDELAKLLNPDGTPGLTDPDDIPDLPDKAITQPGDLWILGEHRLLCGDAGVAEDVDRLLDGASIHLVNTDPPYNVRVEPRSSTAIAAGQSSHPDLSKKMHHQKFDVARGVTDPKKAKRKMRAKDRPLEGDFVTDEEFVEMLRAWFGQMARVLEPGRSFYIWGGYANLGNYPPRLKEAGLYFSQGIIWDKQHPVLTRKDYMGSFEICQPPDTKVHTPQGEVPVESLRNGDEVMSFTKRSHAIIGHRHGPKVTVGSRRYGGPLYGVAVGSNTTWSTDGHLFSVRLVPHARRIWGVYLMRRGRWWRVGKTQLLTTWGLGVKQRLDMENGEEAWILSTHYSNTEAATAEQIVSARYGIPTTFWVEANTSKRTVSQIEHIYDKIDPMALHRGALWALSDHHRRLEYPFIRSGNTRAKYSRRVSFLVCACNLLPGAMEVPVPTGGPRFVWSAVRHVDVQSYSGPVYSLDVEKYHHYIADGIVTHNCFYGWLEGAGHSFFGPNNATDLWHLKKVAPQKMVHLTEKPVELAVRAMQYSSKTGEHVLDLFGGSGSTLIGAEQTGRKAYLMEIDPLYCDVIVQRHEQFTGQKAERVPLEVTA